MGDSEDERFREWIMDILSKDSALSGPQIIKKMSRAWFHPKPEVINPILDGLEKGGLIRKKDDGRYELTPGTTFGGKRKS